MPQHQPTANERTFQGILWSFINRILSDQESPRFKIITQEENVGQGTSRFSDGILYSNSDAGNKTLFELKNSSWDATDETLVMDAMTKAFNAGMKYFVTGTPRQLVVFKTFIPQTSVYERKLKIYPLSNVKKDDDVKSPFYEKQVYSKLADFLKELAEIVHEEKKIQWDSIDKFYVNKLSAYILEASAETFESVFGRIQSDPDFQQRLKEYLKSQDVFNVSLEFKMEDVYNICQLANYLLYLKMVFYSYLQRDVPSLNLRPIEIPEEKRLLNKALRERFDDVLKHDFDLIFKRSVLDEFGFSQEYIPVLKRNTYEIQNLNFHDLDCDLMGAIYNTLIENQEQHDRGQHFTNTNEVDIVNSFCIRDNTHYVFDSGCGAGTFLVRAYSLLKGFHPSLNHEQLLERLWGVEIAPFPAFLSAMNLSLLNIATHDNYPVIIQSDFSDVKANSSYKLFFKNESQLFKVKRLDEKHGQVQMPAFDACVGNPPYIRQELLGADKKKWSELVGIEWHIKKINQQSNLYVYYLMHTAAFIKEGGRLGYVIFADWLGSGFGEMLQKFLLDHFKLIAVIDNQKVRSFATASVNTVILIVERCNNRIEREGNTIRFVRVTRDYSEIIGDNNDESRLDSVHRFVKSIESATKTTKTKDYFLIARNQNELEAESTINGKYTNGNWGTKYLRSPSILSTILEIGKNNLLPLNDVAIVKYGIKTGANDFFYVIDQTDQIRDLKDEDYQLTFGFRREKHKIDWRTFGWYYSELSNRHYIMERRFFKPVFKTQREALNLEVDRDRLQYKALVCNESKTSLRKYKIKIAEYIEEAESSKYQIDSRPTCNQRVSSESGRQWFHLGEELFVGDFIFPSKIGEYYRLIDNRKAKVYCDKVNYNIKVREEFEEFTDILFLILNSITFRFFVDLFARQMTGSQTLSDVDVEVVKNTMIVDPRLLKRHKGDLSRILKSMTSREQGTIFEEVEKPDRRELDTIIFETLGLGKKEVDNLYEEACIFVERRKEKSSSVETTKQKRKLTYEESVKLIKDRFPEIRRYSVLIDGSPSKTFSIPNFRPKFPQDSKSGSRNLFSKYPIYFKDNEAQTTVNFENPEQVKLYQWFYEKLEVKGVKLEIPYDSDVCLVILKSLSEDFKNYAGQVAGVLKTYRSKANYISVYKDVLLTKD